MQPLKVGVTGGIGSGKSIVCRIFRTLGIPVFDADTEAKQLMTTDQQLMKAIRVAFGEHAYRSDGTLNRAYLATEVFGNPDKLKTLNALVHPVTIRAGEEWARQQTHVPYTIKEAALLFESGSFVQNDYNILVSAPASLRIERVMQRDGVSQAQVQARMEQQWDEEKKRELANFVLVNDDKQAVLPQVLELDRFFRLQQH